MHGKKVGTNYFHKLTEGFEKEWGEQRNNLCPVLVPGIE